MIKHNKYVILLIAVGLLPSNCVAEIRKAKKPETPKSQQKFVLPCAAGTEQYGEFGTKMVCRQPVGKGKYRPEGQFVAWHANGEKKIDGEFARGEKHGIWTTYLRNGRKKTVETFYSGKRQSLTKFDKYGRPKLPPKEELADGEQSISTDTKKSSKDKKISWRFMRK